MTHTATYHFPLSTDRKKSRGAVIIEMALVLPLLLMLILGGITLADAYRRLTTIGYVSQAVADAVAAGEIAEDEAADWAAVRAGASLECLAVIPGVGDPCFEDGATAPRVQVVLLRPHRLEFGMFSTVVELRGRATAAK